MWLNRLRMLTTQQGETRTKTLTFILVLINKPQNNLRNLHKARNLIECIQII